MCRPDDWNLAAGKVSWAISSGVLTLQNGLHQPREFPYDDGLCPLGLSASLPLLAETPSGKAQTAVGYSLRRRIAEIRLQEGCMRTRMKLVAPNERPWDQASSVCLAG